MYQDREKRGLAPNHWWVRTYEKGWWRGSQQQPQDRNQQQYMAVTPQAQGQPQQPPQQVVYFNTDGYNNPVGQPFVPPAQAIQAPRQVSFANLPPPPQPSMMPATQSRARAFSVGKDQSGNTVYTALT